MNSKGMFYTNVSDYETKEDMMNDFIALRMYDMAKDKEIERLNKEIKEYQEELEKADSITQSCIFEGKEEATKSYRECLNLLERLHSIIKEVREYIEENQEEHKYTDRGGFTYTEGHFLRDSDTLLEILDKESNNDTK